jgi:AcrR family transcriptional regulator
VSSAERAAGAGEAEPAAEHLDVVGERIRVTVYRRFPRKDVLITAMAARETRRVVAAIDAQTSGLERISDRIAESFVLLLRVMREHPLIQQLLAVEPDEMLRYLTIDGEPVIAVGTAYVAAQIRRAQRDGQAPEYDAEPVAEIVARLAHSLTLTPGGVIPVDDEQAAREFVRNHVRPLILRGAS